MTGPHFFVFLRYHWGLADINAYISTDLPETALSWWCKHCRCLLQPQGKRPSCIMWSLLSSVICLLKRAMTPVVPINPSCCGLITELPTKSRWQQQYPLFYFFDWLVFLELTATTFYPTPESAMLRYLQFTATGSQQRPGCHQDGQFHRTTRQLSCPRVLQSLSDGMESAHARGSETT